MATRTYTADIYTLALNPNKKRRRLFSQMLSTNVATGNTGRVHIGYDSQPQLAVGDPSSGDVLTQGSYVDKNKKQGTMGPAHKGSVWIRPITTDAILEVFEETDGEEKDDTGK